MSRRTLSFLSGSALLLLALGAQAQPANDECSNATMVAVPSLTAGETCDANPSFNLPPVCGSFLDLFDNNVWFSFIGTGEQVTLSTCLDLGGSADFDTQIAVLSGDCAEPVLTCVDGDDSDPLCSEFGPSTVTLCTEEGFEYLVVVTGFIACGNFELAVIDDGPCLTTCVTAESLEIGSAIDGTTMDALSSPDVPQCCTEDDGQVMNTSPDTWYKVVGEGGRLQVTTCPDLGGAADFDTRISVFCGTCDELRCVDASEDDLTCSPGNRLTSTVEWCAEAGVEYLIQVHGFSDSTGNFTVAANDISGGVSCDDFPICVDSDPCCEGCNLFQLVRLAFPDPPPLSDMHPCFGAPAPFASDLCCETANYFLPLIPGMPTMLPFGHPCTGPCPADCITLDFAGVDAGTDAETAFSGVTITGTSTVRIFDTSTPTCDDDDLLTPGAGAGNDMARGNAAVLQEDSDCEPNDAQDGGVMTFTFDAPIKLDWLGVLDTEEGGEVRTYDDGGGLLDTVTIAASENNGWQRIEVLNGCGVSVVEVTLNGSGAVTELACDSGGRRGSSVGRPLGSGRVIRGGVSDGRRGSVADSRRDPGAGRTRR
ncbi:MAG: hypothetical protein AAF533_23925 [Acidobacteriota bacterium]